MIKETHNTGQARKNKISSCSIMSSVCMSGPPWHRGLFTASSTTYLKIIILKNFNKRVSQSWYFHAFLYAADNNDGVNVGSNIPQKSCDKIWEESNGLRIRIRIRIRIVYCPNI